MESEEPLHPAIRVALIYVTAGSAWILTTDWLAETFAANQMEEAWFQTVKGLVFVALSALLIGWLVDRETKRRDRARSLLHDFVNLTPDPAMVRRHDNDRIVVANERFCQAVGTTVEQLNGVPASDFDQTLLELEEPGLRDDLSNGGDAVHYRQTFTRPDTSNVELAISSRVVTRGDRDLVFTVGRDITDVLQAYEETIRGWARALELRDDETYEHTLRVTKATVALAREFGVPEDDIPHIRRGALLHDIGKVGIPDAILHKAASPTEEEWELIKKHPVYARQLLEPIDHLCPAIDIPFHHHERWDGNGYPEGLSGEEIPLSARLFAVVDVWDALLSDRPYRDAWSRERVRDHLKEKSGTQFQPEIVETFLQMEARRGDELRDVEVDVAVLN
jgi:putative nucleotidyltransferase with HDIG domain/PAS domain S-box-containing protein